MTVYGGFVSGVRVGSREKGSSHGQPPNKANTLETTTIVLLRSSDPLNSSISTLSTD